MHRNAFALPVEQVPSPEGKGRGQRLPAVPAAARRGQHSAALAAANKQIHTATSDKVILMENVKPLSTSMYKACVTLALLTN